MAFTAGRVPVAIVDDDVTPPPPTLPPTPMNGSSSSTAGSSNKRRFLVARGKEMVLAAWQVSKIFSPPVQHPVLRLFCLWIIATRILLTFVLTLMVGGCLEGWWWVVVCARRAFLS